MRGVVADSHCAALVDWEWCPRDVRHPAGRVAVGCLPVARPATAAPVRDDVGGACRRAHTHRAGTPRYAATEVPGTVAPLSSCYLQAAARRGRGPQHTRGCCRPGL